MSKPRIVISGGGTGGHIFPAIAIANAIKKKSPDCEILFVGALGKMEMEKVPEAGYKIIGLPVVGLQRRLTTKNLAFPFKLMKSLTYAKGILKDFKPDLAIGVGGYASGPLLFQAARMKIPSLIQEQNSYAGITNKLLGKSVNKICVAYKGMQKFFPEKKLILTGNPVREIIKNSGGKREASMAHFKLDASKKTVLVIGGSLGALSINQSILRSLEMLHKNNVQLIWQTGKTYIGEAQLALKEYSNNNFIASEFIKEMDLAYASADVVVSRAGAISVSELCVVGKPTILIPSPNVAEDHQTKNAMALVKENAAVFIKDDLAVKSLTTELKDLLDSEEKMKELAKNIKKLAFANADEKIAAEAISLINSKEKH